MMSFFKKILKYTNAIFVDDVFEYSQKVFYDGYAIAQIIDSRAEILRNTDSGVRDWYYSVKETWSLLKNSLSRFEKDFNCLKYIVTSNIKTSDISNKYYAQNCKANSASGASANGVNYSHNAHAHKIFDDEYNINDLNNIIRAKNNNRSMNLGKLEKILRDDNNYPFDNDIRTVLKASMNLKSGNELYKNMERLNYDDNIASKSMKEEMVHMYMHSTLNLNDMSKHLENKYGMHISVSTLSKRSREYINEHYCKNGVRITCRKDAKNLAIT